jgi:hypothetical protein
MRVCKQKASCPKTPSNNLRILDRAAIDIAMQDYDPISEAAWQDVSKPPGENLTRSFRAKRHVKTQSAPNRRRLVFKWLL